MRKKPVLVTCWGDICCCSTNLQVNEEQYMAGKFLHDPAHLPSKVHCFLVQDFEFDQYLVIVE